MPGLNLKSLRETSVLVHVLVILFGMRAWVDLSGMWVEMPVLVDRLPEGWALASYVSVTIQLANICVIFYTIIHLIAPKVVTETRVIGGIYVMGGAACLLLAFFWDRTTVIGGETHSTTVLVLAFFMGAMDSSTSVVFVMFMTVLKAPYLTSMFMGQGIGQFLVSLVALAQGVGNTYCKNVTTLEFIHQNGSQYNNNITSSYLEAVLLPPRFSPREFFLIVFGLEMISALAFAFIGLAPVCKKEQAAVQTAPPEPVKKKHNKNQTNNQYACTCALEEVTYRSDQDCSCDTTINANNERCFQFDRPTNCNARQIQHLDRQNSSEGETKGITQMAEKFVQSEPKRINALILLMTGWNNCIWNGIGRTLQTYACLPFSRNTYHVSVLAAEAMNPLACFFAIFVPTSSRVLLAGLSAFASAVAAYVALTASLSPSPPLVGTLLGDIVTILCQAALSGSAAYSKVCFAGICRQRGRRASMWFGVVLQGGALIGAIIAFLLVTVFNVFEAAPLCAE